MKKLFSLLLAAALILGLVPVTANAAVISGDCGTNVHYSLDTATGALTVSGSGAMEDYNSYPYIRPWENYKDQITSVLVESGVTNVGGNAFSECANLEAVTAYGVSSVDGLAFSCCPKLANVFLPETVTVIGMSAFDSCAALTSIRLPAALETIGDAAFEFSGLTDVTIPAGVTAIPAYAFCGCEDLVSVSVPAGLLSVGENAFLGCTALSLIVYRGVASGWDAVTVDQNENGNAAWNAAAVIIAAGSCGANVSYLFDEATGTLTVSGSGAMADYPTGDGMPWEDYRELINAVVIGEGVTSVGACAFKECETLEAISLPSTLEAISFYAFSGCSALASAVIPEGVTLIDMEAFSGCAFLSSLTLPSTLETIGLSAFSFAINLPSVEIPAGVTAIPAYAFCGCEDLAEITIPASVLSVGESAFSGCTSLAVVHYGGTDSDWAAITIEENNEPLLAAALDPGGEALRWSYDPQTATLTVGGAAEIPDYGTVRDPDDESEWITTAPWAAYRLLAQHLVIGDEVVSIGESAFEGMAALESVSFGKNFRLIGDGAFYGCTGLSELTVDPANENVYSEADCVILAMSGAPENLLILGGDVSTIPAGVTAIAKDAFHDRVILATVQIPEGVTAIGEGAFQGCLNLAAVSIPATLVSIDEYAFTSCSALAQVFYNGTQSEYQQRVTVSQFGNGKFLNADFVFLGEAGVLLIGDFTGWDAAEDDFTYAPDGSVDLYDVFYLLNSLDFADDYPVTGIRDFTGWDAGEDDFTYAPDGAVDLYDVFYLLNSLDFPDDYPLPDPPSQEQGNTDPAPITPGGSESGFIPR